MTYGQSSAFFAKVKKQRPSRKEVYSMKNAVLLVLLALFAVPIVVPNALAISPQPEPPSKEVKIRLPHPGMGKSMTLGTPMPIPPSKTKGQK